MLVNFMIIGAQKCGTTSLFSYLNQHPSLTGCRIKEPHYFSKERDWRSKLSYYHSLFENKPENLYFEASTTYTFFPTYNHEIWEDIYSYNPEMKFIYIVRDPIERLISGYMHSYERGYIDLPLEQAIQSNDSFLNISRYYTQIIPYIRRFGQEKVLIIEFEKLIKDTGSTLNEIAHFLDIDPNALLKVEPHRSNESLGGRKKNKKYDHPSFFLRQVKRFLPMIWEKMINNNNRGFYVKPHLSAKLEHQLRIMLETEISGIEHLLGRSLSHWR